MNHTILSFFLLFTCSLFSIELNQLSYPHFSENPLLSTKEKHLTKPHLLPINHPIKPLLDSLFQSRVSQNRASLEEAGFHIFARNKPAYIQVVTHPLIPHYVLKMYLDTELHTKEKIPAWKWFVYRCEGAKKVKKVIIKKKIKHFVVPNKWIYPLPASPGPVGNETYLQKHSIIVAEQMPLIDDAENLRLWKEAITEDYLDELYVILTHASSVRARPDNIHFLSNGQMAIIDTEYAHKNPDMKTLRAFLSKNMRAYWNSLIMADD